MEQPEIREVWASNFFEEMRLVDCILDAFEFVAIDTEFPGFLRNTPRDAPPGLRYKDLCFNVNSLKLIQLGFTLFDVDGNIGGCWQINFSDFDVSTDVHVGESIDLLRQSGINFEKNRMHGVDFCCFTRRFNQLLSKHTRFSWVTFHGQYDVAYLLKILTSQSIPCSESEFVHLIGDVLGSVYDVKYIAECCLELRCKSVGLERLSRILAVERVGESHQAGSDCLLTAKVFVEMVSVMAQQYPWIPINAFDGYLYGSSFKVGNQTLQPLPTQGQHYTRQQNYGLACGPYYGMHGPCFLVSIT